MNEIKQAAPKMVAFVVNGYRAWPNGNAAFQFQLSLNGGRQKAIMVVNEFARIFRVVWSDGDIDDLHI
jgi:hypothetical protein